MKDSVPLAPLQRLAWFNLIVFVLVVALFVAAVPFFEWHLRLPLAIALRRAQGTLGVLGLWGFGAYFNYDRKRRAMVKLDELETIISQRAMTLGMRIFWLVFVSYNMVVYAIFTGRHQTTAPVDLFIDQLWIGWIVFMVAQSIAVLVQYRRSSSDATL